MTAAELISDNLPCVKPSDSLELVLNWLEEFKVTQLPIVDKGKFIGIITENNLLDAPDINITLGEILYIDEETSFVGGKTFFIYEGKHLYEVISLMSQFKLEILPVIDSEKNYLGVITAREVIQHLANVFASNEEGSILVVKNTQNNYSVSEIGRIVESVNAQILSLYMMDIPETNQIQISLKLNVVNPERVTAAFERFKYEIVMSYFNVDRIEDYRKNLDALFQMLD